MRYFLIITTHVGMPLSKEVLKYVNPTTRENHLRTRIYLDDIDVDKELKNSGFSIFKKASLDGQLAMYILSPTN